MTTPPLIRIERVTKRYGDYLRSSLPPFWQTTDPAVVRAALQRLGES